MAGVSEARLARLREACHQQGLDALYVRNTSNIQWASAFDGVFDEEPAHALFVTDKQAVLHTDSRYATACEHAARGASITIDTAREGHSAFAARMWRETTCEGKLGIEDSISLAEYRALERAFAGGDGEQLARVSADECACASDVSARCMPFKETSGLVVGLRAVKDASEIARLKAAQAITDAAFAHIVSFMRPGMTERDVQIELEDYMRRHGADGLAFPSIVATGVNGASPHAIPGATRLEAGQCVVMDFGARAQGYCSDMTRMVFVGQPDARLRDAYEVLRQANEQVEAMLKPGVTGKEAHEMAEHMLAQGGFGGKMGHGLGHGVGIDIHEEPVLAPRNDQPLVPGNVVTVEPGIYIPGEFGMRLEDFGVITDNGFEVFTQSSHDMVVL